MAKKPTLTKGQIRKRNALKKSIGDKLGEDAFTKWLKQQASAKASTQADPVADKLLKAIKRLEKDRSFKLGNKGYVVKRAKGKGAKGFVVEKIIK